MLVVSGGDGYIDFRIGKWHALGIPNLFPLNLITYVRQKKLNSPT